MNRKILIISPTPTHPTIAGNRARILEFCKVYQHLSLDVYFLYLGHDGTADREEMNLFFGEDRCYFFQSKRKKKWYQNRLIKKLNLKNTFFAPFIYNYDVDQWFDTNCIPLIQEISSQHQFDFVQAEYIFTTKALEFFAPSTTTLLDTHDKFSNRWRLFRDRGLQPNWFSTWPSEEKKALNRADVIIAIQQHEEAYFSSLSPPSKQIVTIGHPIEYVPIGKTESIDPKLLMVAGKGKMNIDGFNYFYKKVFPILLSQYPDFELLVGGSLCDILKNQLLDNVTLLHRRKYIKDFYKEADIVINPSLFGTGLKIKSVESMGFGKYLVTTPTGASGLEEHAGKSFLMAENEQEFAAKVIKIYNDSALRIDLQKNIKEFVENWNRDIEEKMRMIIKHPV